MLASPSSSSAEATRAPHAGPVLGTAAITCQASSLMLPLRGALPEELPDLTDAPRVQDNEGFSVRLDCPRIPVADVRSVTFCVNGAEQGHLIFSRSQEHLSGTVRFANDESWGKPFLLFFDVVYVSFLIERQDGSQEELFSQPMLCESSDPRDMLNLERMVASLIELDDPDIRAWMFLDDDEDRRALLRAGRSRAARSLPSYVSLTEGIAAVLRAEYSYFRAKGRQTIEKKPGLEPYHRVKSVSVDGFQWLMRNTDQLMEVDGPAGVQYRGRGYVPRKMRTDVTRRSWDTYENQVITSFLETVATDAERVRHQLETYLADRGAADADQAILAGSVRVPAHVLRLAQAGMLKGLLDRLDAVTDSLRALQSRYAALLGLAPKPLVGMPERTRTFHEVQPYAQVFECVLRWFRFGEFTLDEQTILLHVWTADRLFEYYSLIELLGLLKRNGYVADGDHPSAIYPYELPAPEALAPSIANTYRLRKGDVRATLYYEPVVGGSSFQNGLRLYRTTGSSNPYRWSRGADERSFYRPDFVIRFEDGHGEERYVVLDAKFAGSRSIRNHHLPHVMDKYVLDIAADTPKGAADMVWILQGRQDRYQDEPLWLYRDSPLARTVRHAPPTDIGVAQLGSSPEAAPLLWERMRTRIPWI